MKIQEKDKQAIINILLITLKNLNLFKDSNSQYGLYYMVSESMFQRYDLYKTIIYLLYNSLPFLLRLKYSIKGKPQFWFYDNLQYKVSAETWYEPRIKLIEKCLKKLGYNEK